jgi:hypothetical protein
VLNGGLPEGMILSKLGHRGGAVFLIPAAVKGRAPPVRKNRGLRQTKDTS